MGVNPLRFEAGRSGQPAEDQERAGASEPASLRIEEQLGPVALVEERPSARKVTAQ